MLVRFYAPPVLCSSGFMPLRFYARPVLCSSSFMPLWFYAPSVVAPPGYEPIRVKAHEPMQPGINPPVMSPLGISPFSFEPSRIQAHLVLAHTGTYMVPGYDPTAPGITTCDCKPILFNSVRYKTDQVYYALVKRNPHLSPGHVCVCVCGGGGGGIHIDWCQNRENTPPHGDIVCQHT